MRTGKPGERLMERVCRLSACICAGAAALLCLFLLAGGLPALGEIGAADFLLGKVWRPENGEFGVLPMLLGTLSVTAGAMALGVPLGLLTAVWLSRFCPKRWYSGARTAVALLAGIPSIVCGFFGMTVIVPLVRQLFGGSGRSILSAWLLLGLMILPSVITVSEAALQAVPEAYYDGALALGATHERAVFTVLVPAARWGILTAAVLGLGRAVGEATAVAMVAGNQTAMPGSILRGIRTLTANIMLEMGYAEGLHRRSLFASGALLLALILLVDLGAACLRGKGEGK